MELVPGSLRGRICNVEQVPGSSRGRICDVEQVPGSLQDRICDVEQVPGTIWGRICDVEKVPGTLQGPGTWRAQDQRRFSDVLGACLVALNVRFAAGNVAVARAAAALNFNGPVGWKHYYN